jgi:hypothetical protein
VWEGFWNALGRTTPRSPVRPRSHSPRCSRRQNPRRKAHRRSPTPQPCPGPSWRPGSGGCWRYPWPRSREHFSGGHRARALHSGMLAHIEDASRTGAGRELATGALKRGPGAPFRPIQAR